MHRRIAPTPITSLIEIDSLESFKKQKKEGEKQLHGRLHFQVMT